MRPERARLLVTALRCPPTSIPCKPLAFAAAWAGPKQRGGATDRWRAPLRSEPMPAIMSNNVPLFFAADTSGSFSRTATASAGARARCLSSAASRMTAAEAAGAALRPGDSAAPLCRPPPCPPPRSRTHRTFLASRPPSLQARTCDRWRSCCCSPWCSYGASAACCASRSWLLQRPAAAPWWPPSPAR